MNRKTFCSVLLLLLPLLTLCGQEAYMGQIQITRRSFSLSGNQLHIQMDVNYEGLQMPSDESLTLTPFCWRESSRSICRLFLLTVRKNRKCTSVPVYWVERPKRATVRIPFPRWY